ncbi:hypothetical protein ABES03_16820 [Neobacillus rhizosphaerae]|uniref:hypothetical protein n=1 Tax=Neobacillus rhizosphaerae TaxID=2880965 RepID=UPI003D28FF8E
MIITPSHNGKKRNNHPPQQYSVASTFYPQPRPLNLTEGELLDLLEDGLNKGYFSNNFREILKEKL